MLLSRQQRLVLCLTALLGIAAATASAQTTISTDQAKAHVGQTVVVQGRVASVHTSRAGHTYLNFDRPFPDQTFTAVIFRSDSSKFSNPAQWQGKTVRVRGMITLYRGKPEIILKEPDQLF